MVRFRVRQGVAPTEAWLRQQSKQLPLATSLVRTFPRHADSTRLGRWYELYLSDAEQVDRTVRLLKSMKAIEEAEPFTAPQPCFRPNDPSYASQPYLRTIGLEAAWDSTQGDTTVIIGIVDSGTDPTHPDLEPNLWINRAEILNGIDDDGDGYIDNRIGIDLAGADYTRMVYDNNPTCGGAGGPSHGVHVSGIAAASTNNGKGGAGVAYRCRFLPVKVAADNATSFFKAYEGVVYAADHGAKIINCSFVQTDYSPIGADAIAYCIARGCIVVAGAGNTGTTGPAYPANLPGVISVASCEIDGSRSSFSSYGPWVGIVAPGSSIYSTEYPNNFGIRSGTSMATPIVSGAMALLKSFYPLESSEQLKARILSTADTNIFRIAANTPIATQLGAGRINIIRAIQHRGPGFRVEQVEGRTLAGRSLSGGEDSILVRFSAKNWLGRSSTAASLTVGSFTGGFENLSVRFPLGRVASGASTPLSFKLKIPAAAGDNLSLVLRFTFQDSGYAFKENRVLILNPTTLDWQAPSFRTTTTSNGRLGFLNLFSGIGQGITYGDFAHLYESGYLLALGGDTVYSVVRSDPGRQSNDFLRLGRAKSVPVGSAWRTEAFFTDGGSTTPRGIKVHLRQGAGLSPADSNFLLCQAVLTNTSSQTIRQAYWGLFADWDIAPGGLQDRVAYDSSLYLTLCKPAAFPGPVYGLLPLTNQPKGAAALLNPGTAAQPNLNDGWSNPEKAQLLRSGTSLARQTRTPVQGDISHLSMLGPFALAPGDSLILAHAFVFGDDSATAVERARSALRFYNQVTGSKSASSAIRWYVTPNPAPNQFQITTAHPLHLTLFSSTGRIEETWLLAPGTHHLRTNLPPGLYILRDSAGQSQRLVLSR